MKFVLQSDLHGKHQHITAPEDPDTYLILSGDIDEMYRQNRHREIIEKVTSMYKGVFYLPGNHEYYDSNIYNINSKLHDLNNEFDNLYVLLNTDYLFEEENILVIGSTLWSSFDNRNPLKMLEAKSGMNDFKYIRHGTIYEPWKRKLLPDDTANFHEQTIKYLRTQIAKRRVDNPDVKVLVCTHHAPHRNSIHANFAGNPLNSAYCTDLDELIEELQVQVWTHGHMHNSFDYEVHNTRIICNPRGYEDRYGTIENQDFDPNKGFIL